MSDVMDSGGMSDSLNSDSSGSGSGLSPFSGPSSRLNEQANSGICNELVLLLVFEYLEWHIPTICQMELVSVRLRALAQRILWRGFCLKRAPKTTSSVTEGQCKRVPGGWPALAKLFFYCSGCGPSPHFEMPGRPSPGHFVTMARFSKTSGRSFLAQGCGRDVLHVSDPCEHANPEGGPRKVELGVYRGVFRSFPQSMTREFLIRRRVGYEEGVRCPYCRRRVWSMAASGMIPRERAARRLGTRTSKMEYFVCLHGHLFGSCWLVHLPAVGEPDEVNSGDDEFMNTDDDEVCDDDKEDEVCDDDKDDDMEV